MSDSRRLDQLKGLLENDPEDSFVLFALAKEYENLESFDTAIDTYEKLRSVDPNYVGLYYHLGGLYAELDNPETALDIYTTGIQIAEKQVDLHALSELKSAKLNLELEL